MVCLDYFTAKIKPRPLFHDIPQADHWKLENSVNVISVKIAASDVGYPVNIFGTVIARDQVDYRCVYLFNRARDNPQLVTSPVCFHRPLFPSFADEI